MGTFVLIRPTQTFYERINHDIDLFVVSRATAVDEVFESYIKEKQPGMFCLTAVSSQFQNTENVARVVKGIDPDMFVVLGGHHASLAPDEAIESPYLDALCVSEGDSAAVDLVAQVEADPATRPTGIPGHVDQGQSHRGNRKNP